jgi:hypothetical protein
LDRLAAGVGNARTSAQGLGLTIGKQKAFNIQYGAYLESPNTNLSAINAAKYDPAQRWAFAAMGITDVDNKDSAQLATEMAQRAKALYAQNQTTGWVHGHGLDLFYSQADLMTLKATSNEQLKAARAGYANTAGGLNPTDSAQIKFQAFTRTLDTAGGTIQASLVNNLGRLTDPISKLSMVVSSAIDKFLKSENLGIIFDRVSEAIGKLGDYLSRPQFITALDSFIGGIGSAAKGISNLLVALGITKAGPTAAANAGGAPIGGGGYTLDATRGFQTPSSVFGISTAPDKQRAAMNYFMAQGWTKAQAAGIVANLYHESSLDEYKWQAGNMPDSRRGFGVAQWEASRIKEFDKWLNKNNKGGHISPYETGPAALARQYAFVQYELTQGQYAKYGAMLHAETDPTGRKEAALVEKYYEGPKVQSGASGKRANTAVHIVLSTPTPMNAQVNGNAAVMVNK